MTIRIKIVVGFLPILSLFSLASCQTVNHSENTSEVSGAITSETVNKSDLAAKEYKKNNHSKKSPEVDVAPAVDISHKYQYKVRGKRYKVFASSKNFQQIGNASWYGPGFHGKRTANGEIYNMNSMTAAHKTLPLGCKVRVTNLSNQKKIIVRINDRGPFHGGRIIDLSKTAARKLGILGKGYAKVHIKIIQ